MFKVYDDQDSGNICFGTEKDGQRYFIKFAGAPTERYNGNPADAIARLKATLPVYLSLIHIYSHIDSAVGKFPLAEAVIRETEFPEELIVSTSAAKLKSFLRQY